jgi:hypothetical protein
MKRCFLLLMLVPVLVFAEPLYSPTWGFFLDLPEGYNYIDGNDRDRFSFSGPGGAMFDLVIYYDGYGTMDNLVNDINRRIGNTGEVDSFNYNEKQAAIIELNFGGYRGWGLCVELEVSSDGRLPLLLALAYGPAGRNDLELFHISALDSICPSVEERYYPGPIIEYSYPRGEMKQVRLEGGINALVRENDAQAAQVLIEREFFILSNYANTQFWQEAWLRYYRFIYRDSWDRINNPVSALVANWGGFNANNETAKKAFAQRALAFVQGFNYERGLSESDFINLVTAVVQRRGDCDSRSMLWAIILARADIRSAIMVSRQYSHAMGLAEIDGNGARFDAYGTRWMVAETTDKVDIGLIAQDVSDPRHWIGIIFE